MELSSMLNIDTIKKEINKFILENDITEDEVICSIVYEFANKLPYSMDYKDTEFVPGIFLNVAPLNPKRYIFKYSKNLYDRMINWSDTRKSGILLQICFIFQTMLMKQFPSNYQLSDDDYYNLGISEMTGNEEYNRCLFEMLKSLPQYCARVNSTENTEDRRKVLVEVYSIILQIIGQKVGGFRKTSVNKDVISVQHRKATICWAPHRDLEMLYYFENIEYGSEVSSLINNISKQIYGIAISGDDNHMKRILSLDN